MSSTNKIIITNKQTGILIGCLLLFILIVSLLICIQFGFLPHIDNKPRDDFDVFTKFITAMIEKDEGLAKSLVTPENFLRIEKWMRKHEIFKYSFRWIFTNSDPFEYWVGGGAGSCNLNRNECDYGESREYYCYDKLLYRIEFDELISKKFGSEWLIVDWSDIKEIRHNPTTYCK